APPLKLSYKEQREFDEIEDVIAGVEAELEENQREITLAGSDYLKLQELSAIREGLEKRLEQLIERWAYLNERVEEIMKNKT
ncbi:MAG: ABC transporter C-terminal domain-containing protein, partial [Bacteroidota bacterium]